MSGSTVVITYNGTDITNKVLFASTSFEWQFSAVPGTFEITVKDVDRTLSFTSGKEVTLTIDGKLMFGGYVTQVGRRFAFPVVRTDLGLSEVHARQWVLRGVDYNILFDKRVLRYSTAASGDGFLNQLPNTNLYRDTPVEDVINDLFTNYVDMTGFDWTTDVDYTGVQIPGSTAHVHNAWMQQGTTLRKQMADLSQFNGALWYFMPNKHLYFKALESSEARWGFSDMPNKLGVSGEAPGFQGATYGFRDVEVSEDGSYLANDALVWGGSEWSGPGETLFARASNATSITDHGRWQMAETHFGEASYGIQEGVNTRANTIVNGGTGQEAQEYGLRNPQWQVRLTWWGHDVPNNGSGLDHLTPGQLVRFYFYAFGTDIDNPLTLILPLRQVRLSFPSLDASGNGYVKFEGFFGLQTNDPWTLWKYLLDAREHVYTVTPGYVTNSSTTVPLNAWGSFTVEETPNDVITEFTIFINDAGTHIPVGYVAGTTTVYLNGLAQQRDVAYTESDPVNGKITFTTAPSAGDWIWVQCRTLAA